MHLLTLLLPLPYKSLKALMVQRASALGTDVWGQGSGDSAHDSQLFIPAIPAPN